MAENSSTTEMSGGKPYSNSAACLSSRVPGSTRQLFKLVAELLGLQPRNCVYIGDNPNTDIEGAKGVGMMMILVKRRGPKGGHPDYLARSLSDAAKLLMRN